VDTITRPSSAAQVGDRPRLIVGISGASGAIIGIELLRVLRQLGHIETHLIVTPSGAITAAQEMDFHRADFEALADVVHNVRDIGACVASGSFKSYGMVIAPCSMKTLASVAHGMSDNLLTRAADVMLKERRRLILVARETPLNLAHLRNMTLATEMGAIIMPPVPAFYTRPKSIEDVVAHLVGRILDLFDIEHSQIAHRWNGLSEDFARHKTKALLEDEPGDVS
jgi:2,5-furandicarboxylate decarboxylase 2